MGPIFLSTGTFGCEESPDVKTSVDVDVSSDQSLRRRLEDGRPVSNGGKMDRIRGLELHR